MARLATAKTENMNNEELALLYAVFLAYKKAGTVEAQANSSNSRAAPYFAEWLYVALPDKQVQQRAERILAEHEWNQHREHPERFLPVVH